jgi:hypothetical protein
MMEFIIWIREKNGSAWDRPCVWVSVATVEGAESLEHAQRLSDALHAIGVQHKIRLISRPEMATISPKFEQGYLDSNNRQLPQEHELPPYLISRSPAP